MEELFKKLSIKDNIETLSVSKKTKIKLIIEEDDNYNEKTPSFTEKEIKNYDRQKDKCIFKTPEDEYKWAKTQKKTCSKCLTEKKLSDFNGNTSGTDAFDKNGYRLRRPECNICTKNVSKGKTEAKKKQKNWGFHMLRRKELYVRFVINHHPVEIVWYLTIVI